MREAALLSALEGAPKQTSAGAAETAARKHCFNPGSDCLKACRVGDAAMHRRYFEAGFSECARFTGS